MMSPFRRLSAWSSLLTAAPRNFSLPESKCVSTPQTVLLTQAQRGKPLFNSFINIFLAKIRFSVHITHSSVKFTWFAPISHQNFYDRPLFKSGALFDLPPFWIASKQIFLQNENDFLNKPIPNNAEFTFMENKILKKNVFCFFQKIPLFIENPSNKKKKYIKKCIK